MDASKHMLSCARQILLPLCILAVYLAGSVAFLQNVGNADGWTMIDATYFACATLATVGYGDLSPQTGEVRLFAIFMILIGCGIVFPFVAAMTSKFTSAITGKGRELLERAWPPKYIDLDEDGSKDYAVPPPAPVFYFKRLLPSFALVLAVQLASAAAFVMLEGWSYFDAFYHCIVTVSTVGYGDLYIATPEGRIFSSCHMLVGVSLFAEFIATIDSGRSELQLARQRLKAVKQQLDKNLLNRLNGISNELRPLDNDPGGISELEFVIGMMLELGFVDRLTLVPFQKQFRALDLKSDGRLSWADIEEASRLNEVQVKALRKRNTEKYNAKVARKKALKRSNSTTLNLPKEMDNHATVMTSVIPIRANPQILPNNESVEDFKEDGDGLGFEDVHGAETE